jgi:hypothetical protein
VVQTNGQKATKSRAISSFRERKSIAVEVHFAYMLLTADTEISLKMNGYGILYRAFVESTKKAPPSGMKEIRLSLKKSEVPFGTKTNERAPAAT